MGIFIRDEKREIRPELEKSDFGGRISDRNHSVVKGIKGFIKDKLNFESGMSEIKICEDLPNLRYLCAILDTVIDLSLVRCDFQRRYLGFHCY